jgi:hypothetical protein
LETTRTTGKNNFERGAQANYFVRQLLSAAQLRGGKEDVVFISCTCCFQKKS